MSLSARVFYCNLVAVAVGGDNVLIAYSCVGRLVEPSPEPTAAYLVFPVIQLTLIRYWSSFWTIFAPAKVNCSLGPLGNGV